MAVQTTVPTSQNIDEAQRQWMDKVERRQIAMGQLTDLAGGATLSDVITMINSMLATQRTR